MSSQRRIAVAGPFDLAATVFAISGPGGTSARFGDGVYEYAGRNAAGPFQVSLRHEAGSIAAEAWGLGAAFELESLPRMLGLGDDGVTVLLDAPGVVGRLARRFRGMRLGSTGRVFEVLAPTIIGQRITSGEAKQAYRRLVSAHGEPAPGPAGLRLPPAPEAVAAMSYEDLHTAGVERSRAQILIEAARRAPRLEEIMTMERGAAYARLQAIRGIGTWTAGHVMGVAWGDRDAVPVGDFHLPNTVAWLLAGEPRGDDERMLELLEGYRPQRRRVVLFIKRSGATAPRYGPRRAVHDIRSH